MVKHLSSQSSLPKVIFIVLLLVPAVVILGLSPWQAKSNLHPPKPQKHDN